MIVLSRKDLRPWTDRRRRELVALMGEEDVEEYDYLRKALGSGVPLSETSKARLIELHAKAVS